MKFKALHPNFRLPEKGTPGAGAYDLFMPEGGELLPAADSGVKVSLGFAAEVPPGHVALLLPRSGKGSNHGLELNNTCGVIDSDYRGEWFATLRVKNNETFKWEANDRLIQMLLVPVSAVEKFEVVETLEDTTRGEGGLGSTGD